MHAPDRFGPRRGRYPFQGSRRDGNLQEQSIRTTLPGRAHRIYSSAREHRPHAVRRTILPRTDATAARPHSVTRGRFQRPSGDVAVSARRFTRMTRTRNLRNTAVGGLPRTEIGAPLVCQKSMDLLRYRTLFAIEKFPGCLTLRPPRHLRLSDDER